ncbi:hypothetical protein AB0K16_22130 [Nonomuraea jabiensis]|uniref:hypothetical protein n=1 Tax=Nonomuraea jabiensis TaxID=882448 RepID=UPI0034297DAB
MAKTIAAKISEYNRFRFALYVANRDGNSALWEALEAARDDADLSMHELGKPAPGEYADFTHAPYGDWDETAHGDEWAGYARSSFAYRADELGLSEDLPGTDHPYFEDFR